MTEQHANSIGRRIAEYRKRLKIGSSKDLADRIGYSPLSASVIQNIESGRRSDPSVSQLLNISRGLGISPVLLLSSMDKPLETLDLPNLSPAMSELNAADLDAWISASEREKMTFGYGEMQYSMARRDLRKLLKEYEDWIIFEEDFDELSKELTPQEIEAEIASHKATEALIRVLVERLKELIDVSWAKGPWFNDA